MGIVSLLDKVYIFFPSTSRSVNIENLTAVWKNFAILILENPVLDHLYIKKKNRRCLFKVQGFCRIQQDLVPSPVFAKKRKNIKSGTGTSVRNLTLKLLTRPSANSVKT